MIDLTALSLDRFDPTRDSELLHRWVTEDRARFWMMRDHTVEQVREIYTWLDEQPTHHVWWVRAAGHADPVALFQDYVPTAEEVGEHYDVLEGDLGMHFMLAPLSVRQPGFSARVATYVLGQAFADPTVRRMVVDPDARNDKALALFGRLGFELGPVVQLSTKPAQLAFLARERFEARSAR